MSDNEDHEHVTGEKRSRASTPATEPDDGLGETQDSNMSMDSDLMCGICMGVLEHPYTVIPCLHTFDKQCLLDWWNGHGDCPMCRVPSTSARFSFQLKSIVERVDNKRKRKRKIDPTGDNPDQQEIYPFGRAPPPVAANNFIVDDDDDEQDEDDEDEEEEPMVTTGNLAFPCPSCDPNNARGYTCPVPIPMPTDQQIQAEQLRLGAGYIVRQPTRLDIATLVIDATLANNAIGADDHVQCFGCHMYMPKGFNINESQCSACKQHCCYRFDPNGCWSGAELRPRNDLNRFNMTPHAVFGFIHHNHIRANNYERDIFTRYLQQQAISVNKIFEDIADLKREEEGNNDDHKWVDNRSLCGNCVDAAVREKMYEWWVRERAKGLLDAAVRDRGDCWYGHECRTQTHNVHHATSRNHICDNTSAARQRGGAI